MSTETHSRVAATADASAIDAPESDSTQRNALECAIRVWVGTMSLAELRRIDAKVMEVLADRDQAIWVRRHEHDDWHLLSEIACGAIFIACGGDSMPLSEKPETEARPSSADRCGACQQRYRQMRIGQLAATGQVERGLVELVENTEEQRG